MSNTSPVFIQVGDLADGFAPESNILPAISEFAGQIYTLHFANGNVIRHEFTSDHQLAWQITSGPHAGEQGAANYRATNLRDGIYFIDFIKPEARATTVSLVFNLHQQSAVAVIGELPTEADTRIDMFARVERGLPLTSVKADIHFCTLNRDYIADERLMGYTTELIGKRVMYTYSKTERYEHIYLNPNFYAWQCLDGVEQGLADADFCRYIKVSDALYLFVWQEKIVPTLGVVMVDLQRLKTDGKIVGYKGDDFGTLSNFPVGAIAQPLNQTLHPAIAD